jgi:hypothetical protein
VHQKAILKGASGAVHVAKVVDRRPFRVDSRRQSLLDRLA